MKQKLAFVAGFGIGVTLTLIGVGVQIGVRMARLAEEADAAIDEELQELLVRDDGDDD